MMWQKWSKSVKFFTLGSMIFTVSPIPASAAEMSNASVSAQITMERPFSPTNASGQLARQKTLAPNAKSAVIMDYATGKVLFERDAHEKLPMASITKIMTMLLIMESVDSGKLKWIDKVETSEYAASMGGSQVFLKSGEVMTAQDMLKAIAIVSANDACVAMAEHLYGSEENFVARMNDRAKELGMDDTHFSNCNGLPVENHYSSAHDIAMMSRELLKHEEITKWTSVYSDYLRKDSANPIWLVNTNKLVRFYDGADGLKTGYTVEAKYCLSATAKKNGFRVIAVVMGEPKSTTRNAEVSGLLNWTFSQYTSKELYKRGQVISQLKIRRGVPEMLSVKTADTVGVLQEKGKSKEYETKTNLFKVKAPVKIGQRVGTLQVFEDDDLVAEVPLIAAENIKKAGFFRSVGRTIQYILTFGH